MPVDTAPELRFGVAKEDLTGLAGLALAASLVKYLGLAEALAKRVRIKQRRRGYSNGSTYTLTLDGTAWDAVYKVLAPMSLALGTTGGMISIAPGGRLLPSQRPRA